MLFLALVGSTNTGTRRRRVPFFFILTSACCSKKVRAKSMIRALRLGLENKYQKSVVVKVGVYTERGLAWQDRVEVHPEGFEPPTVGLKGHCSAVEL